MIDRSTVAALAGLTLAALPGLAQAATPNDATGTYLTEDGRARIRVEKCGPQNTNLCGYVVWLKVPLNDKGQPRVDFKNPDPKKQARPSLGHQLIMGLKPDADARYAGKIYNADEGKFYDVTMWSEQPTELSVRGCMLGFLCGSQTWSKVTDVAPGQLTAATNQPGGPRSDPEWTPKAAPAKPAGAKPGADKPAAAPAAE
ncbi:hypothetical protein PMNALOAF_2933 [Methylobacterium adhaesivum]|jgi:uncharacterized protein (DUF2147 family)|uniref:DUF2147 domain-containing protein n=1 Tax=Methylobacterium adhaesivum TaxID=333297 RepID=A0ABT8BNB3_9HYPH|nr:DUF2147 domain-containing protein [Methylobacterium adhaesivum]MDN3592890.1 DUF2147 domain-containing protein [Methylobacterium adhaesivum]GJD31671.1 hypothetical protein PMNALOAF_2933 [Methylobacterium adhaesivum]